MSAFASDLNEIVQRAEAAEARVRKLEHDIEVDDWHAAFVKAEARAAMLQEALGPNARILNQRRDEQIKQLTAERDAFAAENDAIHRAINQMCGTDTSTIEAVQHVIDQRDEWHSAFIAADEMYGKTIEQRDELARKLEQAQRKIASATDKAERALNQALNEGDGVYRP